MNVKSSLWKGMLAAAVFLPALGSAAAQDQQGPAQQGQQQRSIVGVWDVSITIVSCTTGAPLGTTGSAMVMFNDGGTVTEVSGNSNQSTGLGTWRHLGGSRYSSLSKFLLYSTFGPAAINGTQVLTREIELNKTADEYTNTATAKTYDTSGNLINTVCVTATATRFK